MLFTLAVVLSALPVRAQTSQPYFPPTKDVIDLCSHPSGERSGVAEQFVERGWQRLEEPYPDWLPSLLADGELITVFAAPQMNFSGVNTQTAIVPDMGETLGALQKTSEGGVFDTLWWEGDHRAFLRISDALPNAFPEVDMECWLFGSSTEAIDRVLHAIREHQGTEHEGQFGPVTTVHTTSYGHPPHQPFTGLLGMMVKVGFLVDRPQLEAQIGAGPSSISLFRLDTGAFVDQFNRNPNASYFLRISRHVGSEGQ